MKQKKIRKQLAKKYGRDVRVIEHVTKHPFKFLHELMRSKHDNRPLRIAYLGVFLQKDRMNKFKYYNDIIARKILKFNNYENNNERKKSAIT